MSNKFNEYEMIQPCTGGNLIDYPRLQPSNYSDQTYEYKKSYVPSMQYKQHNSNYSNGNPMSSYFKNIFAPGTYKKKY